MTEDEAVAMLARAVREVLAKRGFAAPPVEEIIAALLKPDAE